MLELKNVRNLVIKTIFWISIICLGIEIKSQGSLEYILNKGQWHSNVLYKATLSNGAIFLEKDRLTFVYREAIDRHNPDHNPTKVEKGHAYQVIFENSNPNVKIKATGKLDTYFNFFLGNDTTKWRGDCPAYQSVTYFGIYPNIDLQVYSLGGNVKYSFWLHPGANHKDIRMRYDGVDNLRINSNGDLMTILSIGNSIEMKPTSFIHSISEKRSIGSRYKLDSNYLTFELDSHQTMWTEKIEIDPQIIFSTYSGSLGDNFGATATYDFQGNLYGAGLVFATGYVTTLGAFDLTFGGASDIGITKFNSNGSARIYSTYLGGSSYDVPHSLVVDQNGRLILLGTTSSLDYPTTTNAYNRIFNGGPALIGIPSLNGLGVAYPNGADIVITKFNAAGSALIGSTYYGGNGTDGIGLSSSLVINYGDGVRGEVIVDTLDRVYIATLSNSTNLPTHVSSYQSTNNGLFDGVVALFNTSLSSLLGATYIGGSSDDAIYDITFDRNGQLVGAGGTVSNDFPTTTGALQTSWSGSTDGFIFRIDPSLSSLSHCTYYGTFDYDQIYFVEVNDSNHVFVFGQTNHQSSSYYIVNSQFNVSTPAQNNRGQFISSLSSSLNQKLRSMTFGRGNHNPDISPTAFLVDYCNKIFVTGWGSNVGSSVFLLGVNGMPITPNAHQSSVFSSNGMHMMVMEGDMSSMHYGSFFGGTTLQSLEHVDGGTCRFDKNGLVYHAVCAGCGGLNNFPIFPNTTPPSVVGPTNGTVGTSNPNCNLAVFKFDFGLPVTANFSSNTDCAPGNISFTNLSHIVGSSATYLWDFGNGSTSTAQNPSIFYNTPGIYEVKLIVTDSQSCNIKDTIIKSVLVIGSKRDTLPPLKVCLGNSVRIGFRNVTDPNINIVWTPSNTIDDPNLLAPYATPQTNTFYQAIITKSNCIDTFTQHVIVEQPQPIQIIGPDEMCSGVSGLFIATNYSDGTYTWNPVVNKLSQNRDTASFIISSPISISVMYTSPLGCLSSATKSVGVINPNVQLIAPQASCEGATINLTSTSNIPGAVYNYSPASLVLSQSGANATARMDSGRWYYVSANVSGLCEASDSVYIGTLRQYSFWQIDSTTCPNQQIFTSVQSSVPITVRWQPVSNVISGQNTTNATFQVNNSEFDISYISILNSDTNCKIKDTQRIRLISMSTQLMADQTRCKDSNVTLYYNPFPDVAYSWNPADRMIGQNNSNVIFTTDTSRWIKLTATDNSGCIVHDSIFITVIDNLINTVMVDSGYCSYDTFRVQTTQMQGAIYQWYPATSIYGSSQSSEAVGQVSMSQWLKVQIIDTNLCNLLDSIWIDVFDTSTGIQADFSANQGCAIDSVTFFNISQNTSTSSHFFWDFGISGKSSSISPKVKLIQSDSLAIKLLVIDSGRCIQRDSILKVLEILKNRKIVKPTTYICLGDTSVLDIGNLYDTFDNIEWLPNIEIMRRDSLKAYVFPTVDRTYTAYLLQNNCLDTIVFPTIVRPPVPVSIVGDRNTCLLSPIKLTATLTNGVTYQWTSSGNSILSAFRDSAEVYINQSPYIVSLIVTDSNNCKLQDTHLITTVSLDIALQFDSIGCAPDTLSIKTFANLKSGVWSISPSQQVLLITDTLIRLRVDSSQRWLVSYQLNPLCRDVDSVRYDLLSDRVNLMGDTVVCMPEPIRATSNVSPRWRIDWSPVSILTSGQGTANAIFNSSSLPTTIVSTATLLSDSSCIYSDSLTFRLAQDVINLKADQTRCRDSGVIIRYSSLKNYQYRWEPSFLMVRSVGDSLAEFKLDSSRYYYLTITRSDGCVVRDSIYIQVIEDLFRLTSDTIVCAQQQFSAKSSKQIGATYSWFPSSNLVSGQGTNIAVFSIQNSQYIGLTIVDTNGCVIRDSILVKTLDSNIFRILNTDTINCAKDTIVLSVMGPKGLIYSWQPASSILSGQASDVARAFINQSTTFRVLASNASGSCSAIDSIRIIKDSTQIKISYPFIGCLDDTIELRVNYNPNLMYRWQPNNWIINQDTLVQYILKKKTLYSCVATLNSPSGCVYRDSAWIDYSKLAINVQAIATPNPLMYGDTTQLDVSSRNGIRDYQWFPDSFISRVDIPDPKAWPLDTLIYSLKVTDTNNCSHIDTLKLNIAYELCGFPEVFVPSGFTPNGNNTNDLLRVRGDNIEEMEFRVYDRWGQLMYETHDQSKGWDGKYRGEALEPSVFAYTLWVRCIGGKEYRHSGNVTLIK